MRITTLAEEKKKAFKLYSEGITQKEIAKTVGVTEKSILAWKKRYNWDKRLKEEDRDGCQSTFLVLSDIDREAILSNPYAADSLSHAISNINHNLKVIHQILTENQLIPKP
ncbi:helix-turn-helix domain-containing protein [Rufibacter sp. LB8]|uniref:terminase gpP N-terminus-related DNA-binding protein n=1 Tax=Rufibacter sp. LB8 TaxID=2777781 RepID=UPI00178C1B67|nr:helix-turn-helix domain-containing protein [Rufibacter sp. LB8]